MRAHAAKRLSGRRLIGWIDAFQKEPAAEPFRLSDSALAGLSEEMLTTAEWDGDVIAVTVGRDTVTISSAASNEQAVARVEQHLRGRACPRIATDLTPLAIARVTSL